MYGSFYNLSYAHKFLTSKMYHMLFTLFLKILELPLLSLLFVFSVFDFTVTPDFSEILSLREVNFFEKSFVSRISLFRTDFIVHVISCRAFLRFSLVPLFIKRFVNCTFPSGALLFLFQLSKMLENNPKY